MEKNRLNVEEAFSYLKAGYSLYAIINKKEEHFSYQENAILINSNHKSIRISPYSFLELYQDAFFFLMEEEEEEVDTKKDEEYYSWRQ